MHLASFLLCSRMFSRERTINDLPPRDKMTFSPQLSQESSESPRIHRLKLIQFPGEKREWHWKLSPIIQMAASLCLICSYLPQEKKENEWALEVLSELQRPCQASLWEVNSLPAFTIFMLQLRWVQLRYFASIHTGHPGVGRVSQMKGTEMLLCAEVWGSSVAMGVRGEKLVDVGSEETSSLKSVTCVRNLRSWTRVRAEGQWGWDWEVSDGGFVESEAPN